MPIPNSFPWFACKRWEKNDAPKPEKEPGTGRVIFICTRTYFMRKPF